VSLGFEERRSTASESVDREVDCLPVGLTSLFLRFILLGTNLASRDTSMLRRLSSLDRRKPPGLSLSTKPSTDSLREGSSTSVDELISDWAEMFALLVFRPRRSLDNLPLPLGGGDGSRRVVDMIKR